MTFIEYLVAGVLIWMANEHGRVMGYRKGKKEGIEWLGRCLNGKC